MTPAQLTRFRAHLAANRRPFYQRDRERSLRHAGWNDALDFVERTLAAVLGEQPTAEAYIEGRKA